uniref:Uncharacterized protein n=1 Tax=Panagrolaimus sp. ES5 TaxID=591445 RepID=A0AC34GXY8_9BILA
MVETRSRTRTQQTAVVIDVTPKKKRPRSPESLTPPKKNGNVSRKRCKQTPSTPGAKKIRSDNGTAAGKNKRLRSVPRSQPIVYHENVDDDVMEDVQKPEDPQSASRSPSVYSEAVDVSKSDLANKTEDPQSTLRSPSVHSEDIDDTKSDLSNINMTTPENKQSTSARLKLAVLRSRSIIEHHRTISSSPPKNNIPDRLPYQAWSRKYYDLKDPYNLPSVLPIDNPTMIQADRLYDDEEEMVFARESSTESVLPSPSSSLDSTLSDETFEESPGKLGSCLCYLTKATIDDEEAAAVCGAGYAFLCSKRAFADFHVYTSGNLVSFRIAEQFKIPPFEVSGKEMSENNVAAYITLKTTDECAEIIAENVYADDSDTSGPSGCDKCPCSIK